MPHVQFRTGEATTNGRAVQLVVDGLDITSSVYDEGFGIVRVGEGESQQWGVQMILAADYLDADLPEAVLFASRSEDAV